jgi:gliding motility-associated-like protein
MRPFYLLFIMLFINVAKVNAQVIYCPPTNIGFESGNFNGWACDTGRVDESGNVQVVSSQPVNNWQTLYSTSTYPQVDYYGGFPTLCPYGGNYSVKLGNDSINKRADRISYTFTVPAGADPFDLIFYYAVVLQNPPHLSYQQPRFTVKTFDVTDNTYVDCASFNFIASASLPGFKLSPIGDTVFYKDWSPSTIHLKGYAGKQMRLEFTTNDCTLGKHFGYAYLDVNEDCGSPISGNTFCTNQNFVQLAAPGGFGNYLWYNGDLSKTLYDGQVLTISPPPPDGTKYAVVLYPFAGLGCTDTLYTTVNSNSANLVLKVKDTLYACAGGSVDLTAASVTAGSSSGLQLSYFTDMYGLDYLFKPQSLLTSGTYYIKAVNPEGCITIMPVNVQIGNPTIEVTNPASVIYPVTVDLSTTFTHDNSYTYGYYLDNAANKPVADFHHVAYSGTYYIEAVNIAGCTTIKPVQVMVTPPAPPTIKAFNTFTPNNDGINDYFSINITGYGAFGSLSIYNRYGQLMFQTKSGDTPWDGKYNGTLAPVGTYYWIFEGKNTYFNTKVVQSGFITLIR